MKKTNKTFKRFAAITSASLLAACAMAPVFTSAVDITINETEQGHKYSAYQIFSGTLEDGALTEIQWGSGVNAVAVDGTDNDLLEKLNALTFEKGGADVFEGLADAAAVANAIAAIEYDGAVATYGIMDQIADIFETYKKGTPITATYNNGYTLTIPDDNTGYYLVVDEKNTDSPDGFKTASKYILKVTSTGAEISVKKDAPQVMKKIKENIDYAGKPTFDGIEMDDAGYNDTADYCIGDYVPFKLYGSLPSTLANYQGPYKYVFHDSYDSQFGAPTDIKVKISVGDTWYYVKAGTGLTDVSGYYKSSGENTMDISFADIKNVNLYTDAGCTTQAMTTDTPPVAIRPNASSIVTVEYTAQLTVSAELGTPGQENSVELEYANDSNYEFEGDGTETDEQKYNDVPTSETLPDTVVAFTYQLDLTKVDGKNEATTLKDAKFVLRRTVDGVEQYAVLTNNIITDWVSANGEVDINTIAGTITSDAWTAVNSTSTTLVPSVVTTPENGKFSFIGLDADTYELVEIKAPVGYKISNDGKVFTLKVEADTSNSQDDNTINGEELVELKLTDGSGTEEGNLATGNLETGVLATKITNTSSAELPGTGGIGTTIFYLGGGAMAAIGGIYLISKRRMRKSEE